MDIDRVVQLLGTAMDGCFQKSPTDDENNSLFVEAAAMLVELKELYTSIEARSV